MPAARAMLMAVAGIIPRDHHDPDAGGPCILAMADRDAVGRTGSSQIRCRPRNSRSRSWWFSGNRLLGILCPSPTPMHPVGPWRPSRPYRRSHGVLPKSSLLDVAQVPATASGAPPWWRPSRRSLTGRTQAWVTCRAACPGRAGYSLDQATSRDGRCSESRPGSIVRRPGGWLAPWGRRDRPPAGQDREYSRRSMDRSPAGRPAGLGDGSAESCHRSRSRRLTRHLVDASGFQSCRRRGRSPSPRASRWRRMRRVKTRCAWRSAMRPGPGRP